MVRGRPIQERVKEIMEYVQRYGKMTIDECVRIERVSRNYALNLMKDTVAFYPQLVLKYDDVPTLYLREEYDELQISEKKKEDNQTLGGEED